MYSEIEKLVVEAKNGNRDARGEVLERVEGLIVNKIKKYGAYKSSLDYEDRLQDGRLVVLEAIDSYDLDYGVYFLGFLKSKLRYFYLNKIRDKSSSHLSLDYTVSEDGEDLLSQLEDDGPSTEEYLEVDEMNRELKLILESLAPREREVISLYYYHGLDMKEIAHKLDKSYRTIVNAKVRAIKKFQEKIKEN